MLDTSLKDKKEFEITKLRNLIYWPIRIIAIVCAILVIIYIDEYKILTLVSVGLLYVNGILAVKYLVNSSRILLLWGIIGEAVEELEKETKNIHEIKAKLLYKEDINILMGKSHKKIMDGIDKLLNKIEISKKNTTINEKMNIGLVNNVANKLDKPIDSIINGINNLKSEAVDNEGAVLVLSEKANVLKKLIDELFEMAKLSSGDMKLETDEVDIVALLKQALIEYKDNIDSSDLILKVNLPKGKILINCNGEKLWRVFDILIQNLIKHSLENSRVYIDLYSDDERVYLKLRNTSKKELNINIDELVNIINQNNDENTSGLAMEIAKQLVKIQNGKFDIDINADLFTVLISFPIKAEGEYEYDR